MNKEPSFSIVIPFKKGIAYLQKCIKSVSEQSYANYDIIVLTDSTSNEDGSVDWLKQLRQDKIRIISSTEVLNINQNWARIIEIEKREYFTILGYDDVLYPGYLKTMADIIQKNPEATLFQTQFDCIDENDRLISEPPKMDPSLTGPQFLEKVLQNKYLIMASGYMMRSNDYDAIKGIPVYYPNLLYADFELWLRLTFLNQQVVSKEKCFSFRIHQSTTKTSSERLMVKAFQYFITYLKELNEDRECQKIIGEYLGPFLQYHCNFIAYRLIRKKRKLRDSLTVADLITQFEKFAQEFGVDENLYVQNKNIRLAKWIDSSLFARNSYLLLKKLISRPLIGSSSN